MAHIQLTDHLPDYIGQIGPVVYMIYQHLVFFINSRPVIAMHARVVEEITHLPPAFVVNFLPFLFQINHHVHVVERHKIFCFCLA